MQVNWRQNKPMVASVIAHVVVLVWSLVSFTARPLAAPPAGGMPVDIVSNAAFNQMLKDAKTPPQKVIEKKAPPKEVEVRDAEISDLPEITAPPPQAAPKPAQEDKPPPEQKQVAAPPEKVAPPEKTEPPPEAVEKAAAEALERAKEKAAQEKAARDKAQAEAAKKAAERKAAEAKKREEAKKLEEAKRKEEERVKAKLLAEQKNKEKPPAEDKSQFNSGSIQALLDKRKPRRMASAGDTVNTAPSRASTNAGAPGMTGNDWGAFISRMRQCWDEPTGRDARDIAVVLRIQMKPDGTLSAAPQLVDRASGAAYQVAADAALRAVTKCAPYTFMPAAKYESWKDFEINFDPRTVRRG